MITNISDYNYDLFLKACSHEEVFGARCITEYKINPRNIFMQIVEDNHPSTAIYIGNNVAIIASDETADVKELAQFLKQQKVKEIDTNLEQCMKLKEILGGVKESSYYMEYRGEKIEEMPRNIYPATDLYEVFEVLQKSHEYYRTHLDYYVWSSQTCEKIYHSLMEVYIMYDEGHPIATGSICAKSDTAEIIAAVAVIPEYRNKKLGSKMSLFLTQLILSRDKKPVLISGYDEVSKLYKKIGYVTTGRWGELYI